MMDGLLTCRVCERPDDVVDRVWYRALQTTREAARTQTSTTRCRRSAAVDMTPASWRHDDARATSQVCRGGWRHRRRNPGSWRRLRPESAGSSTDDSSQSRSPLNPRRHLCRSRHHLASRNRSSSVPRAIQRTLPATSQVNWRAHSLERISRRTGLSLGLRYAGRREGRCSLLPVNNSIGPNRCTFIGNQQQNSDRLYDVGPSYANRFWRNMYSNFPSLGKSIKKQTK